MPVRLDIAPDVLFWAVDRSGVARASIEERFPLSAWVTGTRKPTIKQLEAFARATHTPMGMLLLSAPPDEQMPVPDFRRMAGTDVARPTADLLDAIYLCQQRQDWYREFSLANGEGPPEFAGSLEPGSNLEAQLGEHILVVSVQAGRVRDSIGRG